MFDLLALLSTWSSGWLSALLSCPISTRKDLLRYISKTDVTVVHSTVCLGLLAVSFLYNIVYQTVLLSAQYKWDDGQKSFFLSFFCRIDIGLPGSSIRDSMGVVYINRHHTHTHVHFSSSFVLFVVVVVVVSCYLLSSFNRRMVLTRGMKRISFVFSID